METLAKYVADWLSLGPGWGRDIVFAVIILATAAAVLTGVKAMWRRWPSR